MTKSLEDYLERIHILIEQGRRARVHEVAGELNVRMPSVNKAVSELKKLGLVEQEPYGDLRLTEDGARLSNEIHERHTLLTAFLTKLGVTSETAEHDACLMEHILSAETLEKVQAYVNKGKRKK
jgi:DtxR family Mn-dependent transcriptional regulator